MHAEALGVTSLNAQRLRAPTRSLDVCGSPGVPCSATSYNGYISRSREDCHEERRRN